MVSDIITEIRALFPDAKVNSGYIRIRCPYHKDGKEKRPSMGILIEPRNGLDAGFCKCFACGKITNIKTLLEEQGLELTQPLPLKAAKPDTLVPLQTQRRMHKQELPFRKSTYLESRGISERTQERFKCYEKDGKVFMPVFDKDGYFIYSNGRSTSGKRFYIEEHAQKTLWGVEELNKSLPIAVCESQIDALSFWEVGIQAVATLGADNTHVLKEIKDSTSTFILAFDNDIAGLKATNAAIEILGKWRCSRVHLPPGIDINQALQDIQDKHRFLEYIKSVIEKEE